MGMNVYTFDGEGRGAHIGKRYAAGYWCWDCREELNQEPERRRAGNKYVWTCPGCGKSSDGKEKGRFNPAMRELGFAKDSPRAHEGIDGASGFTWQIGPDGLGESRREVKKALLSVPYVMTEYGEIWSLAKFLEMFKDVIVENDEDREFS